ncbi:MAG: hypothetical protein IIB08_07700 [Bacteroidetes bacterium]|nr:hypothetical protein [Bacteroidota bacterium]
MDKPNIDEASDTLLAYAAGVIDSDGCIGAYARKKNKLGIPTCYQVMVRVSQVTSVIPILFVHKFGGQFYAKPSKRGGKTMYSWRVTDAQAGIFLTAIAKYLLIKAEQNYLVTALQTL